MSHHMLDVRVKTQGIVFETILPSGKLLSCTSAAALDEGIRQFHKDNPKYGLVVYTPTARYMAATRYPQEEEGDES